MMRSWLPLLAALFAMGLPLVASAQPADPPPVTASAQPPPQELKKSVAERLSAVLRLPVRIDQLRYELLTSRFVGNGFEVGASSAPILQVAEFALKLALFGHKRGVERVTAKGVTLRLFGDRPLDRQLRWPRRPFELRRGEILQATLLLGDSGVKLEGVTLSLAQVNLQVGKQGQLSAAKGRFTLAAERLVSDGKNLGQLELKGRLKGKAALLDVSLKGGYGTLELSGKVGLGGKVLGPWRLAGSLDLHPRPGIQLKGRAQLRGATISKLTAQLKLRPQSGKMPALLRLGELPPVKVGGSAGKRQLRGTLRDLHMR